MSMRDLVFEKRLGAVRRAVRHLPKHLRPAPTCATLREAAEELGLSQTGLKLALRRRRWRTFRLDGKELVPLSVVEMLRR